MFLYSKQLSQLIQCIKITSIRTKGVAALGSERFPAKMYYIIPIWLYVLRVYLSMLRRWNSPSHHLWGIKSVFKKKGFRERWWYETMNAFSFILVWDALQFCTNNRFVENHKIFLRSRMIASVVGFVLSEIFLPPGNRWRDLEFWRCSFCVRDLRAAIHNVLQHAAAREERARAPVLSCLPSVRQRGPVEDSVARTHGGET